MMLRIFSRKKTNVCKIDNIEFLREIVQEHAHEGVFKVLIGSDLQNDFGLKNGALYCEGAEKATPHVVSLLKRNEYDLIILTKDTHTDEYLTTQEGKNLPIKHTIINTRGWRLIESVSDVAMNDTGLTTVLIIEKDTFGSTTLQEVVRLLYQLTNTNIEFDFCGFATNICVISNVVLTKTACPEALVTVHANACAGTTIEDHNHALAVLRSLQVNIV